MSGGVKPVDYLLLNVKHRTNEDWYLELPLDIAPANLAGAKAVTVLKDKGERKSIVLECAIEGTTIVQRLDRRGFDGKEGAYSGDVLLTLTGDQDMVTHIINLELTKGVSPNG
jgi:hypothetical protein